MEERSFKVAAIDVHKKMLAVVVTDASLVGEFHFERRKFGAGAGDLDLLDRWLEEQSVEEVVMESTAQYWKPVWQALEGRYAMNLAQAWPERRRDAHLIQDKPDRPSPLVVRTGLRRAGSGTSPTPRGWREGLWPEN